MTSLFRSALGLMAVALLCGQSATAQQTQSASTAGGSITIAVTDYTVTQLVFWAYYDVGENEQRLAVYGPATEGLAAVVNAVATTAGVTGVDYCPGPKLVTYHFNDDKKEDPKEPTDDELKKIGNGHAFGKHVQGTGGPNGKEFEKGKKIADLEFPNDTIKTNDDFNKHILGITKATKTKKALKNGRWAYWDPATGTVVIYNPKDPDNGTCFRPTPGKKYYDELE